VLRRAPFRLPYADQVPLLAATLAGEPVRPADGARFVGAALHHNVAAYALEHAELAAGDGRSLEDAYAVQVLRTGVLRRALPPVAAELATACGAPPIVVKGAAVGERLYPDWRLRPYLDLDLLVPRVQLDAAVAALVASGFDALEEFRPGYAETLGHDVHVARGTGIASVHVELHWRVSDDAIGVPLDHARIAATAEVLELEGAALAAPSPQLQLLVLALHLLSDRAKRLAWIHDLVLAARALDDDAWDDAFATARELDLAWVLHRALDYARVHLGFERTRPLSAGEPPPWGPVRAVESLDARAAPHFGRLAALGWRERAAYLRTVFVPTRAGLRASVGHDGAATPVLVMRHLGRVLRSAVPWRP
jgi:Uncharacterised nucleotidyltransferase